MEDDIQETIFTENITKEIEKNFDKETSNKELEVPIIQKSLLQKSNTKKEEVVVKSTTHNCLNVLTGIFNIPFLVAILSISLCYIPEVRVNFRFKIRPLYEIHRL